MVKLLIIADDFTGALDTGVQFTEKGIETRVVTNVNYDFSCVEKNVQVLVIDAETRHLPGEQAYQVVFKIAKRAKNVGISYIYKKTDSALRGNVGSELRAVLDATQEYTLHFLPAFPRMHRITKNGIHYIDGIPVAESVFGKDPFEPVTCSSIKKLIGEEVPVTNIYSIEQWTLKPGIMVYDVSSDEELQKIAKFLAEKNTLSTIAGCAGFAEQLPELLQLSGKKKKVNALTPRLIVACGSLNPITKAQLDVAEKNGFIRIRLTPEQKLNRAFYETEMGVHTLKKWASLVSENPCCIVDTNELSNDDETLLYAKKHGLSLEDLRVRISTTLGYVVKELISLGMEGTLMIVGGDCLIGFMKQIECDMIVPICEVEPGTVLSEVEIQGQIFGILSKSGGFGDQQLIDRLGKRIVGRKELKEYAE